jgi:hypothetical protein
LPLFFSSSGHDVESNDIEASGLESKSVEANRSGKSRFDHSSKSAKNEKSRKSFVVQSVIDTPDGKSILLSHCQFIFLDADVH